jgi:hypothetical protein
MRRKPSYEEALRAGLAAAERELARRLPAGDVAELCNRLDELSPAQQTLRVRNAGGLVGLELVAELIRRAKDSVREAPEVALAEAQFATRIVDAVLVEPRHQGLLADLRSEAWSLVANGFRLVDDWAEAEAAWRKVRKFAGLGSKDPVLAAELKERQAALCIDQRRFDEAKALLQGSAELYRNLGETQRLGRCYLRLFRAFYFDGHLEACLEHAWSAVAALDPQEDQRMSLLAMLYVAGTLGELGQAREGYGLLRGAWPQFERQQDAWLLQGARWTRGRLASEIGKLRTAEKMLAGVREEFLSSRQRLEAALISLDLALVYARRDWPEPQRRLADETAPIFQALHLERETLAACLLYVDAARRQRVTVTLVEDVLRRLEPIRRGGPSARRPIDDPQAGEPG